MTQSVPNTHTQWLEVIFLWIAGVSAAMQFAKLSISYDAVMMHYQTGATLTGATLSVVGIAGLLFGVFAGMIANKIGYLKVLVSALFLGGILSFIQSLLPHFSVFILTRVLEGFSQLGVVVAAPTLIAKLSAPQHKSLTMGLWGTFFGVAFALTGWLGKSMLDQLGLQGLFLSHAFLISCAGVVVYFLLRKNSVLDFVPVIGGQSRIISQMLTIYRNPRALLPSLVFLFYTCTLVSLLTYVPRFVEAERIRATMLVALPLISTGGTFLAGALGQYIMRPQRVALMAYSGVALNALLLPFLLDQTLLFSVIVGVTVLFLGMIPGASLGMIPMLARNPVEQAQGYGLIAQFGNLGATLGPPTFATVITAYGISGFTGLVLIICCCGVVFSLLAGRIQTTR
ncbi:MFS transporter [Marinomonas sp. 15G1-11]|uniref:MFS transporter n=1 Tax=Marinomonas phaeophyticola TaxID=3004091 RepID=A0ABT4JR57_9GAMM|nr:MFS transporter [Marinomonas sp. 15G1-11]MCZ2720766.1 MFS transporter [Marinomonas sp. 15G1-11]